MLQAERAGEELLVRWRRLFALLGVERIVRDIQVAQMGRTATQQCPE